MNKKNNLQIILAQETNEAEHLRQGVSGETHERFIGHKDLQGQRN